MSIRRVSILGGAAALVSALVVFMNPVGLLRAGQPEIIAGEPDDAARGQRLCGAQTTVDEIKRVMFARAIEASEETGEALALLQSDSVARMEEPVLVRYDQELRRAECEGRIVIELPRGVESAFADQRRLRADLAYVAQPAADGSGLVFRLEGVNTAIDALAGAELERMAFRRVPRARPERFAEKPEPNDAPVFEEAGYLDFKPSDLGYNSPHDPGFAPRFRPPPPDPKDYGPVY